jgi:sigma-B regulation protein RsbU (phosphoserine phosphatase)
MDDTPIKRMKFKRSNERRVTPTDAPTNLRHRPTDRRKQGPGWLSLFRDIDEQLVSETIADFDVLTLPAGTLLLKPGDSNDSIYLLLSGQLVAHLDRSYNPQSAMPIKPGECIGEFSAIDGKPVSAYVLALEEVRVLHLSPEAFWSRLMPISGVARNLMVALTERMRRSNEVTLEAHRKQLALQYLKQELEVARQLQAGMLPQRPFFPDRTDLEIEGIMEAASEIGGDLFDAFFVDEHILFFSIGDVCGHGIPAALFMARTIGLIRIAAMTTTRPDHLLERINFRLCEGNDANMFVTLFCAFLDVKTGRMLYSNAGHLAPLLLNKNGITPLTIPNGAMVGVIPGINYSAYEMYLASGDAIICYTDGVTEAQTEAGVEFSVPRLLEIAVRNTNNSLAELLQSVRNELAEFTGNKALSDDCTMLAIRRLNGTN